VPGNSKVEPLKYRELQRQMGRIPCIVKDLPGRRLATCKAALGKHVRRGGVSDAVLLSLSPKRGLIDPEDFCRVLQRTRRGQHTTDVLLLQFL